MMKRLLLLVAAIVSAVNLAASASAQLTPLQDPANLAGERVSPHDPADTLPLNHGAPALQQLLAKLRTRASLMLIVAHPDDEDGGLLTYESRGQGARVAMLTLTRGEGGQNLMSADFDDALGLIRTQELLAADRYFGVDQFFGTEVDFGFSKTKQESFEKWTHERVLYDAVRAVRLYRPLVIASVFVGGPTDGHGQHQVSGEIAQEVFLAAADPNVFPEMIAEGLLPWAPLKLYARVPFSRVTPDGMFDYATGRTIPTRFHNYVTGEDSTAVPTATVMIHEGDKPTDPTLAAAMGGDTFLQFARKGLALQKTQIGANARLAAAGAFDAPYTLMASRVDCINTKAGCPTSATASSSLTWASTKPTTEQSLFDGIDTSLLGIATLALTSPIDLRSALISIDSSVAEAQQLFDPAKPEARVPALRDAIRKLDGLLSIMDEATFGQEFAKANILHELRIKRVQLNDALVLALGISLESTAEAKPNTVNVVNRASTFVAPLAISPGGLVHLHADIAKPLQQVRAQALTGSGSIRMTTSTDDRSFDATFVVSPQLPPTRPYFSRPNLEQPFYTVSDMALRNAPSAPSSFQIVVSFDNEGVPLEVKSIPTIPFPPELSNILVAEPAKLVPALEVTANRLKLIPLNQSDSRRAILFDAAVYANVGGLSGSLTAQLPPKWEANAKQQRGQLGGISRLTATVRPPEPEIVRSPEPQAPFKLDGAGNSSAFFSFNVEARSLAPNTSYLIPLSASTATHAFDGRYVPVGYWGLTHATNYVPAVVKLVAIDLATAPNLRVAYLPGTGDPVPGFLPNLGITPTVLTLKDLTPATLNRFDAVLLGVRAYAAHPELAGPGSQPLLDYAKQGGVVILQYNTARFGDAEAPFPIDVPGDSAHNVVEEAQPVTLLHPEAPLLTWPNRLTPADFDHWVAERGHGFASSWSPQYQPLLETHDVGQDPQQGGLLVARTGKGAYIYCALALYRQLPEGVPGAYRLLANLLSYAKNPNTGK